MKLLEVQSSARQDGSVSRALSDEFIQAWRGHQAIKSKIQHRQRDVGLEPPAHPTALWTQANYTVPEARSPEMANALSKSEELIEELLWADYLVLGVPMYNFSVPCTLKAYLDNIIRINRTFSFEPSTQAFQGLVEGKKALIITPSAGDFTPETPLAHMNFCDTYLKSVLGFIGIQDVTVVAAPNQFMADDAREQSTQAARKELMQLAEQWWEMDKLATFDQYRPLLFAIAYRMLSSATEAEDVLQDAWIRWQSTTTSVEKPRPYLSQLVTRLCIDYLRSARVRRERYVGTWLPEPLAVSSIRSPEEHVTLAESLSFAFLKLLEYLSPTERAAFLLREVFDYSYEDIAKTVGKSTSNCRQIVHRAKQHLRSHKPRIDASPQQKAKVVESFLEHWQQGNLEGLLATMTDDTVFVSDGGGKVVAALYPLESSQKVARFLVALRRSRLIPPITSQLTYVNGQLGIVNSVDGNPQSVFSFEFKEHRIQTIFAVANPDKLDGMYSHYIWPFGVS